MVKGRIEALDGEMRGRMYALIGVVIGETAMDPETFEPRDKDRLREAISNVQRGYELLQKVEKPEGPGTYQALNNWVFYSCVVNDRLSGRLILERARLLRDAALPRRNRNLLTTYCRAAGMFEVIESEREQAREIAQGVVDDPLSSERERRDARQCLALLKTRGAADPPDSTAPADPHS